MEELLKQLGITDYNRKGNSYVVDFTSDYEWDKVRSKLDTCHFVNYDDESSTYTASATSMQYVGRQYTITMLADFENDDYKLTIRQN